MGGETPQASKNGVATPTPTAGFSSALLTDPATDCIYLITVLYNSLTTLSSDDVTVLFFIHVSEKHTLSIFRVETSQAVKFVA
jgi:hypothetical protein